MNPHDAFAEAVREEVARQGNDEALVRLSRDWIRATAATRYSYHYTWMGRPVILFPQDLLAMQELVWALRPEVIVETGIAHGGSLVFYASLLELLGGEGLVVGVDIDIRAHNREAIESHPMARRIRLVEGSSTDPGVVSRVAAWTAGRKGIVVVLDSNHTHDHVLEELRLYARMVPKGGYIVVFDTIVQWMPKNLFADRPWGPGDNPWTAVQAFLAENDRFQVDRAPADKALITVAPDGFLRCVKD
jgi:cephalosporin hydroxylase